MVAKLRTATLLGVDARLIEVEVELSKGLPMLTIIGLGDAAVQEAKYRVQSALRAEGVDLPHKKITINLAPAAIRKDGASLDLPIALGVLTAAGLIEPAILESLLAIGELSLDGALRPVRGALSIAALARDRSIATVAVPASNATEAAAVAGLRVIGPTRLGQLLDHLRGTAELLPTSPPPPHTPQTGGLDLADVRGQNSARRALEIAAAGAHNLLLIGPPGSGKTMLARRLPGILPPLTADEQLDVTKVWSAAGLTLGGNSGLIRERPFRSPHYTASTVALIGGGTTVRPGEISLAHRGVLFLDELPELSRTALEGLRQPLEDREVVVARARQVVRMPASFMLVGAANPCPCGFLGASRGTCRCTPGEITRYAGRISGPLLDRIDLIVEVPALDPSALLVGPPGERSALVRDRVVAARSRSIARGLPSNAELIGARLREATALSTSARDLLLSAMERLCLSARVIDRALRVARTVADLSGSEKVNEEAIAEALRYRAPAGWGHARTAGAARSAA